MAIGFARDIRPSRRVIHLTGSIGVLLDCSFTLSICRKERGLYYTFSTSAKRRQPPATISHKGGEQSNNQGHHCSRYTNFRC